MLSARGKLGLMSLCGLRGPHSSERKSNSRWILIGALLRINVLALSFKWEARPVRTKLSLTNYDNMQGACSRLTDKDPGSKLRMPCCMAASVKSFGLKLELRGKPPGPSTVQENTNGNGTPRRSVLLSGSNPTAYVITLRSEFWAISGSGQVILALDQRQVFSQACLTWWWSAAEVNIMPTSFSILVSMERVRVIGTFVYTVLSTWTCTVLLLDTSRSPPSILTLVGELCTLTVTAAVALTPASIESVAVR